METQTDRLYIKWKIRDCGQTEMHLWYNRRNILRDYSQHLISLLLYLVIRLTQGHSVSRVLREKHKLFSTFTPFLLFILYVIYDLVEIKGALQTVCILTVGF